MYAEGESNQKITDETHQKWIELRKWVDNINKKELKIDWPKDKNGIKTQRSYALLSNGNTYFLCTWAAGGNKAPSPDFVSVEKSIRKFVEDYIDAHKK